MMIAWGQEWRWHDVEGIDRHRAAGRRAVFLFALAARSLRIWDRVHIGYGLLVFMAIVAPWFVLVSLRNPEFSPFFFFHEHLARFGSTTHRARGGIVVFRPVLLSGLAPWTLLFLSRSAISQRLPRNRGRFIRSAC
jgi:4-amino-4-deoxy-L-arabinose transferase-like glycosyltransferase